MFSGPNNPLINVALQGKEVEMEHSPPQTGQVGGGGQGKWIWVLLNLWLPVTFGR